MTTVSRQDYYKSIIQIAHDNTPSNSIKDWAQHPTILQRALALAAIQATFYQEWNDSAYSDAQWVVNKIKKEMKRH